MQHRICAPPCLIIKIIIFRESTGIHDSEMRTDVRPIVGSWLAAIIEAGPCETAGKEWAGIVILPPGFRSRGPRRKIQIVSADVSALWIVFINSARANCAGGFRSYHRLRGKLFVEGVNISVIVVAALHVKNSGSAI